MANDNQTQIQIVADSTKLKPGMAEAQSINKSTADAMRSEWQNAGAQISSTVNGMSSQIKGAFSSIGTTISGMQGIFKTTLGVLAGASVFNSVIGKTAEWTNEVKNLRKALGITGEEASVLNVALRHIGMTGDDYAESAKKLSRTILTNEKAFGDLGITVRNTDGTYKNQYQIMQEVISALGQIKEGTDRNVAMAEIFKRSQVDVGKLMTLNAAAMDEARKKAEALHLIVGPEGEKTMKKYKEAMNDLKLVGDSLSIGIGSAVVPAMAKLGSTLLALPETISSVYKSNQTLIDGILGGVAAWATLTIGVKAWGAITTLTTTMAALKVTALKNLEMAVFLLQGGYKALTVAEIMATGGWVIAAVAGIVVAFNGFGQTVNDTVDVFVILKNSAEKAFYFIKSGIQAMVGDLAGANASMEKALSIDIKAGTGQDWFKQISDFFSGGGGTVTPTVPDINTGNTFEPTSQQTNDAPSAYEVAKSNWQAETDVLGMTNAKKLELYKADLANVQKTAKEELDYKKGLAKLELDANKETIESKIAFLELDLAKQNKTSEQGMAERIRIAKEESELVKKVYGETSKEYAQAKTKEVQLERQAVEVKIRILKEFLDKKAELYQIDYDIEAENIRMRHELGQISDAEQIRQLNELENKKYAIRLQSAQDELELMRANGLAESEDYKKLFNQVELMQKQHTLRVAQQSNALSLAMKKPLVDFTNSVTSAYSRFITSTLTMSTSIKNAFRQLGRSIFQSMVTMATTPMVERFKSALANKLAAQRAANATEVAAHATMESSKTAVSTAGASAQVAVTTAAATTSVVATTTTTAANMSMLEVIGTALSSIPWYGWVGLAILAGVSSAKSGGSSSTASVNLGRSPDSYYSTPTGMGLPSYDVGTWGLPADGPIYGHKDEVIIPAKGGFADAFRNGTFPGQGQQSSNSSMNNKIIINAKALDGRGIGKVLQGAGREVTQSLYKVQRNLNKPNPSKWGKTK